MVVMASRVPRRRANGSASKPLWSATPWATAGCASCMSRARPPPSRSTASPSTRRMAESAENNPVPVATVAIGCHGRASHQASGTYSTIPGVRTRTLMGMAERTPSARRQRREVAIVLVGAAILMALNVILLVREGRKPYASIAGVVLSGGSLLVVATLAGCAIQVVLRREGRLRDTHEMLQA